MRAFWAGLRHAPVRLLDGQRGYLFPWVPVCFASGIGVYFALRTEPSVAVYVALLVPLLLAGVVASVGPLSVRPLALGFALALAGFAVAGARAHSVAGPTLGFRYYGPVEGRVVRIDRSFSDRPRLTLDTVVLSRVGPDRTPQRVRIALHGAVETFDVAPGMRVMTTAHLSPPPGPVEPGGYDFRRAAWFDQIGAVGYSRVPLLRAGPDPPRSLAIWLHRLRHDLSAAVREAVPNMRGAFAAAILTGDRSALSQPVVETLRRSNLAHLLAISGLHMGLLTGFVFAMLRYGLALVPVLALRLRASRVAAVGALTAGAAYLALSGASVATERAFIMVAVALTAVLCDRRALTLRAVALAAMIVLMRQPESLMGPGFQMSFAATIALVAGFGALRDRMRAVPKWARGPVALLMSSSLAGAATAPLAAAHFNQIAQFGLVANLLSVPVMGSLVMPAAVVAACLAPFGLAAPALWVMQTGIGWILFVADRVSALEGAVRLVPAAPPLALAGLGLGGLALCLFRGWPRAAGLGPICASFVLWQAAERPLVLIAESGGLVGVLTAEGRVLSKPRGDGFAASIWLENDGDAATQEAASLRDGFAEQAGGKIAEAGGLTVAVYTGRGAETAGRAGCQRHDVVVTSAAPETASEGPCTLLDPAGLRRHGAVALLKEGDRLRLLTAADVSGTRLWAPR